MYQNESTWSRYEDKLFEDALVMFPEDVIGRWQKIAASVPGKTPEEVRSHYEVLVHDLVLIDSGRVELPSYADDEMFVGWDNNEFRPSQISFGGAKNKEGERKKGTPWTEEEHRTPTQVASHAQKYFLRQNSMKRERKRSSIHDITTTTDTMAVPPPPPANFQGGAAQMGYDHQQSYGYHM
nr:transcription factor DIVARICATA-like [Tanacetum cinerariifolium]